MAQTKDQRIGTRYVRDGEHYDEVLSLIGKAKYDVVVGTSDIKDLYIKEREKTKPFLGLLSTLLRKGVSVRLIHAKEPGENFRLDFDRYKTLAQKLQRRLCPRVHFKIIVIDCKIAYIGSANLTGAAIGMKSSNNRNMEAGILTDEAGLVDAALEHFNSVWEGRYCAKCGRKRFCLDKIS